jgi:Cof subfamily protein (haloacid dehalogenase superfamily)
MNLPKFEKMPKAIAIDLDGTLLNSRTELSPRNHHALQACIEQCIPVIIATSRPLRIFDRIIPAALARNCSLVAMNGALAKGAPPLSGFYREILPEEIAHDIIVLAQENSPETRITIEIDGYNFGINWTPEPGTLWTRNSATPDMVCSIEAAIAQQPCKIAVSSVDIDALTLKLMDKCGDSISIIPAKIANPMLNITAINASKPVALRRLLQPYHIALEDVLAFGDDYPDLDMLQACGIPVAMDNAFPEIKTVCRYRTATNDDDGVAIVLEEMLRSRH